MKYTSAIALGHNGLLKKIPNSNYWEVMEEFHWYMNYNSKIIKIVVPVGFKTNFGSIPKILRIFFDSTKFIGYILHDYLYSIEGKMISEFIKDIKYSRKQVDLILLKTLNLENAKFIEKICIYSGVRIGGFIFFKK